MARNDNGSSKTPAKTTSSPDPMALGIALAEIMERARPIFQKQLARYAEESGQETPLDPAILGRNWMELTTTLLANPGKLAQMQMEYWKDWLSLFQKSSLRFLGEQEKPVIEPEKSDRRFRDPLWQESAVFDFIKQSYLLTSQWMNRTIRDAEGLDPQTARKLEFYTRQFADALAPSNFLLTNPEVLKATIESGGENLIKGLNNLVEDMERGDGGFKIRTTDTKAFRLGENLATTPGKVVFQNDLIQLIQYSPTTKTVHEIPLLIIPPWINKYYILDLRPENSFVKWVVDKGFTVFMVSWVNPDRRHAGKDFGDYMEEGALAALDAIRETTGVPNCNVIGYCIGGTLLTMLLSWLTARKQEDRIASATFFTTLIDFEEPGDLKIFVDDDHMAQIEQALKAKGYLDARYLQTTFSLLRANDMIWSFVVNNYLLGKEPFPFDILYWNEDSTNLPATLHRNYLRDMYRENLLKEPNGLKVKGTPIDVRSIHTPAYFLSTREDHIAPWKATYSGMQLFRGHKIFTLAASGHIAGVVNPPASKKYCYWTSAKTGESADHWLHDAKQTDGSWWPHWAEWLERHSGRHIPPRDPTQGTFKPIEDAPGSYVKVRKVKG